MELHLDRMMYWRAYEELSRVCLDSGISRLGEREQFDFDLRNPRAAINRYERTVSGIAWPFTERELLFMSSLDLGLDACRAGGVKFAG